jgi:hypothetical protein
MLQKAIGVFADRRYAAVDRRYAAVGIDQSRSPLTAQKTPGFGSSADAQHRVE